MEEVPPNSVAPIKKDIEDAVNMNYEQDEVKDDDEGMNTMKILGENMAWLLKKINA